MLLAAMVAAEAVQERDYFLSALGSPLVINGIRAACAAALLIFICSYRRYRKKQ